jgi:hypothetical protein
VTAPEPWREQPPSPRKRRPSQPRSRDPYAPDSKKTQRQTETEFGFGKGLVAPCNNGKPPSEGGIYMGKPPRTYLPEGSLTPRQVKRPKGEVRGYPGDQIAP